MRYFSYNEYLPDSVTPDIVVTKSEEEIRKDFWPYWYDKMCAKFGKEIVDAKWSFEDCLENWIVVNWAWESDENGVENEN